MLLNGNILNDAEQKPMNEEYETSQIIFITQWLKENGLNPKLWDTIEKVAQELINESYVEI